MIAELTRFEPADGRHYLGPDHSSLPAIERLRLDCCELWYTKATATDDLDVLKANSLMEDAAAVRVLSSETEDREWAEAILLLYRCAGEPEQLGLVAVGYQLKVYGVEPPVELQAELGPRKPEARDAEDA